MLFALVSHLPLSSPSPLFTWECVTNGKHNPFFYASWACRLICNWWALIHYGPAPKSMHQSLGVHLFHILLGGGKKAPPFYSFNPSKPGSHAPPLIAARSSWVHWALSSCSLSEETGTPAALSFLWVLTKGMPQFAHAQRKLSKSLLQLYISKWISAVCRTPGLLWHILVWIINVLWPREYYKRDFYSLLIHCTVIPPSRGLALQISAIFFPLCLK